MRRAFTLIELLVTIAIIGVLLAILLPTISSVRESGREAVCLSNLRQAVTACRAYADDYKGKSPAIGQPYASIPNWALVVQSTSGRDGTTPDELYVKPSVLVCPTVDAQYGKEMTRTYAINATGHAGASLPGFPPDPDNYDDPTIQSHISMDRVEFPSKTLMFADSSRTSDTPTSRTASVIDFRIEAHVQQRLGRFHGSSSQRRAFNASMFDGSARLHWEVSPSWSTPLP